MKTMNKKQFERMKEKAAEVLNKNAEGITDREIIAQIYMDGLNDKSMDRGLAMADEALQAVRDFKQSYNNAAEDKDSTLEKLVDQLLEGKSTAERCGILTKMFAAITASNAAMSGGDSEEIENLIRLADEESFTEEQADPELEAGIRAQVMEALNASSVLSQGLLRQADQLEELADENGITRMVLQAGQDEIGYQGIMAMLCYVEVKNGTIKEFPPDLTIKQTACIIAATEAEQQIVKRFTTGELSIELAVALLNILGMILYIKLAAYTMVCGALLAAGLFGFYMAFPAIILLAMFWYSAMDKSVDIWECGSRLLVRTVVAVVRVSVNALLAASREIGEYVNNTVVPAAAAAVKKAWSFVKRIMGIHCEETSEVEENLALETKWA